MKPRSLPSLLLPALAGLGALVGAVWLTLAEPGNSTASEISKSAPRAPARALTTRERLDRLTVATRFTQVPLQPLGEVALDETEEQKLAAVYERLQTQRATQKGEGAAGAARRQSVVAWADELETFVAEHPDSAWTPGLRLELGGAYLARLNYSKALEHWRGAYAATEQRQEPRAREITQEASRNLARLLALTGEVKEFDRLLAAETAKDPRRVQSTWYAAAELRGWVEKYPDEAYKCGLQCLDQLAKMTRPNLYSPTHLFMRPSDPQGYDAATLVKLGVEFGLSTKAVQLADLASLPVPSILHLRVGHFVVVRKQDGNFYEILDPAAGGPVWLTAAELVGETTGVAIVTEETQGGPSSQVLSDLQAALFRGRCYHGTPWDTNAPPPCETCPCPPGGGGGGGGGPPGCGLACRLGNVGKSHGMPSFWIDQPYLNMWVQDTPLHYQPNFGPTVAFTLTYRTRADIGVATADVSPRSRVDGDYYNHWFTSWQGWVVYDADTGHAAKVILPQGGQMAFSFTGTNALSDLNYWTHGQLEKRYSAGNLTGFWLKQPDGSRLEFAYGMAPNDGAGSDGYLLTAERDKEGRATTFSYVEDGYLSTVTAADGVTFNVIHEYQDDLASYGVSKITQITSSLGHSVLLGYGEAGANPDPEITGWGLSSIQDSAGLKTYLDLKVIHTSYIRSPYGLTTIEVKGVEGSGTFTADMLDRYVNVTHPDGSQEAFAALTEYTTSDWPDWTSPQIPNTSTATVSMLDDTARQSRNTFHWGKAARGQMTKALDGTETLDWDDFKLAHIRHWLAHTEDEYTHWGTLSWEQEPSPDGTAEGAVLWYDYAGKPGYSDHNRGTEVMPAVEARVMPDGTTWYRNYTRNSLGNPTLMVERWHNGGSYVTRTNTYTYATGGADLLTHVGPDGVLEAGYAYNPGHQVLRMTNAVSEVTSYTYDGNGRLTSVVTPTSHVTTNYYSGDGATRTEVQLMGTTAYATNITVRYPGQTYVRANLNGGTLTNVTTWFKHTDERGLVTTNIHDSLGRLWERRSSGLVELSHYELWPGQSYTEGTGGKLLLDRTGLVKVAGGTNYSTNTWTYDGLRRPTYQGDAAGTLTAWQYCDCGGPSQVTLGYGLSLAETTTNAYNLAGWKTNVWFPGSGSVAYAYDVLGRLVKTTDALGSTTNLYDNLGRLTQVKNAFGTVETRTYDGEDRLTLLTDRNSVTTTNTYDNLGRIKTRALAGGQAEQWFYTTNVSGPTSYTNQIGKETQWTYDAAGRKTNEVVVGVMTNRFVYNGAGDLTDLYDGNQVGGANRTQWRYDAYGRVTDKVYANNQTNLVYKYDLLSRLTNRWSQAKGDAKYAYDRRGSLTNVDYASSTDLKFQFDALGRTTNMIDAAGTTKYGYTNGLLAFEDGPWSSDTLTYTYNNARQRSQLVILQPTGNAWTNTYAYDSARRLSSVVSPAGTFSYQFSGPGSLVTKLTQPDGFWITNTFDSRARLTDTTLYDNTSTILNRHGYTLNHAHQRTMISRTNYAQTGWNTYVDYTYDNAGEIRTAKTWRTGTNLLAWNFDYGYDAGWNILKRTNNAAVTSYSVNNLNQITSDGGAGYTHDSNGNLTYRPDSNNLNYTYDDENQLASVAAGTFYKLEFTYDGRGRLRVEKTYSWSGSAWVYSSEKRFLYDGMVQVQQRSSSNNPTVTYTRGTDLSGSLAGAGGIGGLLSRGAHAGSPNYQLSSSAHYHADGNGNVTMLVGSGSPSIKAYYLYDPFGRTLSSGGTLATANVMRFSSKPVVGDYSTLYYYGYRLYDPTIAKWLNRDPIQEQGGNNIYSFVRNAAISVVDYLGLIPPMEVPWWPPPSPPKPPPYEGDNGNCYNYACNRPPKPGTPGNMYPGERKALQDWGDMKAWDCDVISLQVRADYDYDPNVDEPVNGACKKGYHAIRPEVTANGQGFHFKRQNPDNGSWWEKPNDTTTPRRCSPHNPLNKGDIQCPSICVPD